MQLTDCIYIPGHKGFLGKNLVNKLRVLGYTNLVFSDFDLREQSNVSQFFCSHSIDYVINCAGQVGGILENINHPFEFLYNNLMIQNNLIINSISSRVKKFLNLGSSCIYPKDFPTQPMTEECLMKGDLEKTNYGYALAKICGLKLCEYANKSSHTKFISLMPANLYGPEDKFDLEKSHALSALILKTYNVIKNKENSVKVWGSGQAFREWLYVDDLVDCIIWSMNNLEKTDTFLNVGTNSDIQMNVLAIKIINIMVYLMGAEKIPYIENDISKPDGMMKKLMDSTKINNLGWKSKVDLDEGLLLTCEWFLKRNGIYEK